MGGALSLRYALKYGDRISGLVLSGPAVALDGAPACIKPISKIPSLFFPKPGTFPIKPGLVTRDKKMVAAIQVEVAQAADTAHARRGRPVTGWIDQRLAA